VVEFNLNVNIKRPRDKDKPEDGAKGAGGVRPRRGATMAKANLDLNLWRSSPTSSATSTAAIRASGRWRRACCARSA
jgi:hypothetical protein